MQAKKSLGYWQNKTELFKKYKDEKRRKQNRFEKKNRQQNEEVNTSNSSSGGNNISKTLLSGKVTSDSITIEMNPSITGDLPPIWVEIHHQTDNLIKEIIEIKKDLVKESALRIRRQFNDNGELDNKINNLTKLASKKIKEAEENLQKIDKLAERTKETEQDRRIRMNVKLSMATQIQELTADLRRQQKGLYDSLKKYDNVGTTGFMHAIDHTQQGQDQMMQDQDMYEQIARERDGEINNIVDMINELSGIYQQLGHLVLEQGTLIDRIDFNITAAKDNTKKANVHLKKTVQYQESPTAKRCIQLLILLIIIFAFILTLKYT